MLSKLAIVSTLLTLTACAADAAARWTGTWAASTQPFMPGTLETYDRQTLRLIVHTSVAGSQVRITLSNLYGTVPLTIAGARIALRADGPRIDPRSDRELRFGGLAAVTIAAHRQVTSDPVALSVPAMSDLAISFFLPHKVEATTSHLLALQTSFVITGNAAGATDFPAPQTINTWPFLSRVDVSGPAPLSSVVAIGSSTTDGDGSTQDQNHRMPDVLASRLQQAGGASARIGVLNAGIIGNRLLEDSPAQSPFGAGLGEAVLARLDRDALDQPGVRFIIVAIGVNDIAFPGSFTRPDEAVSAQSLIQGYRQILSRAHAKGIKVLMTTIPPFGNAIYPEDRTLVLHTPEKEAVRRAVNEWIRTTKEADGVADFDAVLRDPAHPDRLQPRFDSGDHLHANDAGYAASAKAIPLSFFISAISLKSSPVSPKGGEQGQRFAPDPASRWTDKLETSCGCAPSGYSGSPMSTPETKQKSLFLNGVETESIEPTGNAAKDLAAARRFLAEKGIDQPQQRLTLRGKIRNVWRKKFL